MDYITKWPEVFLVADQSAATVARLLVEEIVSRHGVPAEVISDRGRAFLMKEVWGFTKYTLRHTTHKQTASLNVSTGP